jgi:hypothetical protein
VEMNSLFQTVVFIFGSIGFTQIVVDGTIFKPVKAFLAKILPKFFLSALDCYQCTGFWAGVICGFLLSDLNMFLIDWTTLRYVFVCGCAGSCLSYFWAYFLTYLEANTILRQ